MRQAKLFWLLLSLYALGCACSQSLMSACGAAAVFAVLIFLPGCWPRLDFRGRTLVLVFAAWATFSVINLALRPWDDRSLKSCLRIALFALPLLGLVRPRLGASQDPGLRGVLVAAELGLIASAIFALKQFFFDHGPAGAFMGNVNYFAYNLLPTFVFWSELRRREGERGAALPASLAFLGIVLSLARTAGATACLYLCGRGLRPLRRRWGARGFALLLLGCAALGAGLYLNSPAAQVKVKHTLSGHDLSLQWHEVAWSENWKLFLAHPLVGVGYEKNGIDVAKRVDLQGHWLPSHLIFAHSIYLQSLAESGIVGVVLLLAYFGLLLQRCSAIAPLLLSLALGGLTENVLSNSRSLHPFLFYVMLSLIVWPPKLPTETAVQPS